MGALNEVETVPSAASAASVVAVADRNIDIAVVLVSLNHCPKTSFDVVATVVTEATASVAVAVVATIAVVVFVASVSAVVYEGDEKSVASDKIALVESGLLQK